MSELRTVTMAIDPLDFDGIDRADVGQILRDALGEYLAARGIHKASEEGKPCAVAVAEVGPYVADRYRDAAFGLVSRSLKLRNVAKQCTGAMALRRAALTIVAHSDPLE